MGEGVMGGLRLGVGVELGRAMVGERLGERVRVADGMSTAVGKMRNGAGLEAGGSGVGVLGKLPGRLHAERSNNKLRKESKYRPNFIM